MTEEENDERPTESEDQDSLTEEKKEETSLAPKGEAKEGNSDKETASAPKGEAKEANSDKESSFAEGEKKEGEDQEGQSKSKKKEETAEDLLGSKIEPGKVRKAKGSKNVTSGICHVIATFNNTKVTFSDLKGNVISWSSSGKCNFRGSRKSTAYAAQVVTQDAGRTALSHGMKEIIVKVKGPGMGRDSAVRSLQSLGFKVSSIIDVTPVPHNGCRPPKRRRV